MSTETLLLFILIALLVVGLPTWPYSKSWGYAPTGVLSFLLVVFLIWAIAGGRPLFRSNSVGDTIKDAGQDVADTVKDAVN